MSEETAQMQTQLQLYAQEMQKIQIVEFQKAVGTREQLDLQLKENEMVLSELKYLKTDNKVFKQNGPALIPTSVDEAKSNVQKRIDYITGELQCVESMISEYETKQDQLRQSVIALRTKLVSMLPPPQQQQLSAQ
ncbi:hypothetical protein MP228_007402 [Amoeboaphelidium protococcarum]|nr:hypothetical protein MP228_007402 [Amoeboaphelidium protococcarum]